MAKSNREIPHYYLQTRIDMSRALTVAGGGEPQASRSQDRLLPAVLLLKAVAEALREVPELNGFWIDNEPPRFQRDSPRLRHLDEGRRTRRTGHP